MLMHAAGRTQKYVGDADSCLFELQLDAGVGDTTKAQLRVGDQPQDATHVVIPTVALKGLVDDPGAYGMALGKALFDGTMLGTQYDQARAVLEGEKTPIRFRIVLNEPSLDVVRWERLCHRDTGLWVPVASGGSIPFSRFVYVGKVMRSAPVASRPVRVLLVVASPSDLDDYSLAPIEPAEAQSAREMFVSLGTAVEIRELSSFGATRPTIANLTAEMANGPNIVHVLCHGTPDGSGTMLLLERADGKCVPETQKSVVAALRSGFERPRLVFFAACDSAMPTGRASLVSLGPALAATGIDAVLAMSDAVTLETAQTFASQFYKQLFIHGKVDRAANEARALVQNAWDWGVPVLFSLAPEGRLLDFDPGGMGAAFLNVAGHAARVAASARKQAQLADVPDDVMRAVDALIEELEKSHKFLVQDVATKFRAVGDDPATFKDRFTRFYNDFKGYYDTESWRSQNTSCSNVRNISTVALPFFAEAMRGDPEAFKTLKSELDDLSHIDDDLLASMKNFLNSMNDKADEIRKLLDTDLQAAIQLKRDFEEQLSPTFKRSRDLLADLGQSAGRVAAA